jgi:cysteine synthase A
MKVVQSVLDLIGNTPLVELQNLTRGLDSRIFAKLEYLNPSGSIKDRVALRVIEGAEDEGWIEPGDTLVEASTGNTGASLALVGGLKGYRVRIFETTPGKMGEEKRKLMEGYGAEVKELTPGDLETLGGGVPWREVELPGRRICLKLEEDDPNIWWTKQFSNPHHVWAHHTTGREIMDQAEDVDAFLASIGTGGTLMGVAQVLKEELGGVEIVGIQPEGSEELVPGEPYPRTDIKGGIIADMLEEPDLIDGIVRLGEEEAIEMTHRLWREEGIFAGISSGANVHMALKVAERLGAGSTVVTVLHDSGDRYFTEEHYVT